MECRRLEVRQQFNSKTKDYIMLLKRYPNSQLNYLTGFGPLSRLQNNLDRLFAPEVNAERTWHPALEVTEAEGEFVVSVELPGVKASEVKVTLDGDVLTISGERKYEGAQESELRLSERAYGKFERSVRLPAPVQADKVGASGKDGILTVTLPKTEEAKPREIKVAVA